MKLRIARADRLKKVSLRIPHPTRQPIKYVTLNGAPWSNFQSDGETVQLIPSSQPYMIVVQY
jgi:hypothetical protein